MVRALVDYIAEDFLGSMLTASVGSSEDSPYCLLSAAVALNLCCAYGI